MSRDNYTYPVNAEIPVRFPCTVCHNWQPIAAFGKPQHSNQPIICDACRKAMKRENED